MWILREQRGLNAGGRGPDLLDHHISQKQVGYVKPLVLKVWLVILFFPAEPVEGRGLCAGFERRTRPWIIRSLCYSWTVKN